MSVSNAKVDTLRMSLQVSRPVGGILKRVFDVTTAVSLLVFFAPLFAVIVVLVRVADSGPAIFGHERIGYRGNKFQCLKFRTMVADSSDILAKLLSEDAAARAEWRETQKLRKDPRITRIGRILRESSLDELPQLINVLRGDMSVIGPRPIVDEEAERYAADIQTYKMARPGITGLWQVSGRSNCDYNRRVKLDVAYVHNWSLLLDIGILFRTIHVVLKREGSC